MFTPIPNTRSRSRKRTIRRFSKAFESVASRPLSTSISKANLLLSQSSSLSMKPLHDLSTWPTLAVYDIESTEWTNVVLLCHVDELGNRKCFRTMGHYLNWLMQSNVELVFAHWGGKFDVRFVISECVKREWQFEALMSGSMMIVVKVFLPTGRSIVFAESARLMPDSVAKIGKTINLLKLDVDRSHMERLTIRETAEYCYRDCDIVLKGLQEMRRALMEVGADFAFTLASIASRWVRRSSCLDWNRFYEMGDEGKRVYSSDMKEADDFSEPSYFGGRVEVFKLGIHRKKLFYYDIRSSYPHSMLGELPAYPMGRAIPLSSVKRSLERCGITSATVEVPEGTYLPVLPVREGGKLIFPTGRFKGRWANIELLEAFNAGATIEIHSQYLYESEPFLAPFVHTFYKLRQAAIEAGDAFKSYAYKILLNSVYGKLVETVERTAIVYGSKRVSIAIAQGKHVESTGVAGIYRVVSEEEGPFRHVAAGSYVTARSRILLYRYMKRVRDLGGELYYCDTDSIVTDIELPPEPDALGNLKLEMTLTEWECVAPKVYRCITDDGKHIYKCKGTPLDKGDDGEKLSAEKSLARWHDYLNGIRVEREGLNGFLTDVRKGRVDPKAEMLGRALRHGDSKRIHTGEHSKPIAYVGT